MPNNPLQPSFWDNEEYEFWDRIGPTLINLIFAGGMSGHNLLDPRLRVLVNWDVFNRDAIAFLRNYRLTSIRDIHETTRNNVVSAIDDWIRAGERLPVLEARLTPIFGNPRASMIAVTEVTRVYAEGNLAAWRATGLVDGKRWNTARDERVCPICAPLDGMEVGLDENGFTTEAFGVGLTAPPAHPNCRCWITPIVTGGGLRESIRGILG